MSLSDVDVRACQGATVVDRNGDKIGKVEDIYLDDESGQPEWLAVSTGWFSNRLSFVPIRDASYDDDDSSLRVPFDKELVKEAPHCEADGHLSADEEDRLYRHYQGTGMGTTDMDSTTNMTGYAGISGRDDAGDRQVMDADVTRERETVGYDTSGPTTDDAMTRSEERVDVRAEERQVGRARLRKWIETENVTMTVPIRREKARLVTEPITDANVGNAMSGPDLSEEEHEVILNEERPVIEKEVVPVERVRLEKETEVAEEQVSTEVRKERIAMDEGGAGDRIR